MYSIDVLAYPDVLIFYFSSVVILTILFKKTKMDWLLSLAFAFTLSVTTPWLWEIPYHIANSSFFEVFLAAFPLSVLIIASLAYKSGFSKRRLLFLPFSFVLVWLNFPLWGNVNPSLGKSYFSYYPALPLLIIDRIVCTIVLVWIFYPKNRIHFNSWKSKKDSHNFNSSGIEDVLEEYLE